MELRGHHFQMLLKEKPNHYKETENYHKEIKDINRGTKKGRETDDKKSENYQNESQTGPDWLFGLTFGP